MKYNNLLHYETHQKIIFSFNSGRHLKGAVSWKLSSPRTRSSDEFVAGVSDQRRKSPSTSMAPPIFGAPFSTSFTQLVCEKSTRQHITALRSSTAQLVISHWTAIDTLLPIHRRLQEFFLPSAMGGHTQCAVTELRRHLGKDIRTAFYRMPGGVLTEYVMQLRVLRYVTNRTYIF